MKIRSVLFGLVVLVCLFGGLSLVSRMNEDQGGWRPADMYSTYGGSQGVTYSSVTYGSASSAGSSVPVLSSSNSLFRHRGVSSYAPASGFAYSQSPLASSPLASSPQGGLYTTSSAEFRSFGGGGNAGGVSMSGGAIKSSGSAMSAPSSALSVSMPTAPAFAYNRGALPSVAGDMAMASDQAYAGIGNTTGPRGVRGRQNIGDENMEDSWLNWLALMGTTFGTWDESTNTYHYDTYQLYEAWKQYCAGWNYTMGKKPTWDEWLAWFMGSESNPYLWEDGENPLGFSFVPVGDYTPLLILALLYAGFVAFRSRRNKVSSEETIE